MPSPPHAPDGPPLRSHLPLGASLTAVTADSASFLHLLLALHTSDPPRPQVTNGKNAMPAFGGRLSDDDIANVAAYVIKTSSAGW